MTFFEERVLTDSIEIAAAPGMIWEFFENLERNYTTWHPEDHVVCRWEKGKPHEVGSVVYAEEVLAGRLCKIRMVCVNIQKNRTIEYRTSFPLSIFHPKSKYLFEQKGPVTVFTAINHFRIPRIFFRREIESLVDATEKHISEEGENLKALLENKKG